MVNTLAGIRHIDRQSNLYGHLFENWMAMELRAYLSYRRLKCALEFWRIEDQLEVDFVVDHHIALDVKSTTRVSQSDLKALKILKAEGLPLVYYVVSHDPLDRVEGGIHLLH